MWLEWYHWLERWHLTPVSLGVLTYERLDPRYFDVMRLISETLGKKADGK